jgi:hypothetical protein
VQDYGWKLSKPYTLAIFDAKVQMKVTFGDLQGLCRLMLRTSNDFQALQVACSASDAVSIAKATCENVLINLLRAAMKNKKANKALTASGQSIVEDVGAFGKVCLHDEEFAVQSLRPTVQLLQDVVSCRSVDVKQLGKTLEFLDNRMVEGFKKGGGDSEDGLVPGGVVVEFLGGAGKAFYEEARPASA